MADTSELPPAMDSPILFRPSKKRKIYRQRAASPPAVPSSTSPSLPAARLASPASDTEHAADTRGVAVAELLRLRKLRKHRVGGVEFRVASPAASEAQPQAGALVAGDARHDGDAEQEGGLKKFVSQTGTSVEGVDRHMMAYIDSELAKRLHPASVAAQSRTSPPPHHTAAAAAPTAAAPSAPLQRQPATLGKLQEIDLGAEAYERNVQRTEAARRLLSGSPTSAAAPEAKRPRLGRDGKPFRGRKRRNSDDVRRDRLVEEVLRENALEHYEPAPVSSVDTAMVGRDEDADDRLAEAFRREFLDAVEERQRKKPVQQVGQAGRAGQGKKDEEVLKGPKLGGSRSARAAMREVLLKAERGKK